MKIAALFTFFFSALAVVLPPEDSNHPGSTDYTFEYEVLTENFLGRKSTLYIPKTDQASKLIVLGHGQALNLNSYDETFKHFAKKGYAVLFPMFDSGFFDQEWRRMAKDFNDIVQGFVDKYTDRIDSEHILYAGHSKGAYIALMAAGAPNAVEGVASLLLFAPAGYDADYLKSLPKNMPVTITWGEQDDIIKRSDLDEIYNKLEVDHKQFIELVSYNNHKADHYFILNKSSFFGGKNGINNYHYHAVWKWMGGAIDSGFDVTNPYLYGDQAFTTGVDGLEHKLIRNW